jgi:hypothetical protein
LGHFFKVVVMTSEMIRPQRYLPPFVLFLFLVHLIFILMQPDRMLMDPGTGWQLKTGQLLVQTGELPAHDPFSYTVPQQSWTLYQWLFQALSGLLQAAGGIPLVTAVCALVLGWTLLVLMRRMLEHDTQILAALFMVFVVWLVMTMHLQARPHVVTYLFFCLFLLQLERSYLEPKGGVPMFRSLLPLPFLMVLWCNLHGGFVSGLILCGIFWVGSFLDAVTRQEAAGWRRSFVFLACVLACILASFCNPYGWGLHRAILSYLDLESLKYWQEYTTPFVHDSLNVRLFEGTVLFLLVLLARTREKLSWPEIGCLVFFLYHAMSSIRHVILFMLVAAPVVARLAGQWTKEALPALARRLDIITEDQKKSKMGWIYAGLISVLFLGLAWLAPGLFRRDLDDLRLSKASADYIENNRNRFHCMFNTDDLGGALIYRFGPDLKVFMDDRTDLYRDDFILGTYLPVLRMEEGWYGKLEALGVDSAVLPRNSSLGQGFREHGWRLVHEDGWNALYLKK